MLSLAEQALANLKERMSREMKRGIEDGYFGWVKEVFVEIEKSQCLFSKDERKGLDNYGAKAVSEGLEKLVKAKAADKTVLFIYELGKYPHILNAIPPERIIQIVLAFPKDESLSLRLICLAEILAPLAPELHKAYIHGFKQLPTETQKETLAVADQYARRPAYRLMMGNAALQKAGPDPAHAPVLK